MKVYPEKKKKKKKKNDLCVISIENQFLVSFSLHPLRFYATLRHNHRFDFVQIIQNWVQGLNKKRHRVSALKNNKWLRYSKKCRGGRIPPPPVLWGLSVCASDTKKKCNWSVLIIGLLNFCAENKLDQWTIHRITIAIVSLTFAPRNTPKRSI